MSTIWITLSSANMGDNVDERDFDLWAKYVAETIDEAVGFEIHEVDQARFGEAGEDWITGATAEETEIIRRWLAVDGWEAFCSGAWQAMAAETAVGA
jgi:hypothetical protein